MIAPSPLGTIATSSRSCPQCSPAHLDAYAQNLGAAILQRSGGISNGVYKQRCDTLSGKRRWDDKARARARARTRGILCHTITISGWLATQRMVQRAFSYHPNPVLRTSDRILLRPRRTRCVGATALAKVRRPRDSQTPSVLALQQHKERHGVELPLERLTIL